MYLSSWCDEEQTFLVEVLREWLYLKQESTGSDGRKCKISIIRIKQINRHNNQTAPSTPRKYAQKTHFSLHFLAVPTVSYFENWGYAWIMPKKSYHHVKFRKLFLSLTTAEKMPLSNLLLTNHYINQYIGWIALLVQHRTEKPCKGIFHCRLWTVCTAPRCNCIRSTDCVHVCMYACTYVYEFMCACVCVCAHMHARTCVCVYISTHTHTLTHTHTHTL